MNCAPISIPVYKRPGHLRKCIDALLANELACQTVLYIYSDAPSPGDEREVKLVRQYISQIRGFKDVIIIEQQSNKRLSNIIESIEGPLSIHPKLIYIEEDLVVSNAFLQFMNDSLDYYENNTRVFSITGFTQPPCVNPSSFTVSASSIFTAWTCGLWRKKYSIYKDFYSREALHERLAKSITASIKMIVDHTFQMYIYSYLLSKRGELTPDWMIGYYLTENNLLQVFPPVPFASQTGLDGSGWHSTLDSRFDYALGHAASVHLISEFDDLRVRKNANQIKAFHGLGFFDDMKFVIKCAIKIALGRKII